MARLKVSTGHTANPGSTVCDETGLRANIPRRLPQADCTQMQSRQLQQQRLHQRSHVDSTSLPFVQKLPLRTQSQHTGQEHNGKSRVRATPRRAAKAAVSYDAWRSSTKDSDEENVESEWAGSESEGESVPSGDGLGRGSRGPPPDGAWSKRPLFRKPMTGTSTPMNTVDLTESPQRPIDPWQAISRSVSPDLPTTLKFSPPRLKSPFKKPSLPILQPRPETPPASPSKATLTSPRKLQRGAATSHRPSIDAFWNQEAVNDWNDQYSPRKLLISPRKLLASPRKVPLPDSSSENSEGDSGFQSPKKNPTKMSPSKLSPVKKDKEAVAAKKVFEREKFAIADNFLRELDEKIGKGEVSRLAESTGGIQVVWSKKLNSTAGRANWRREALRTKDVEGQVTVAYRHKASIELAEKVIDDEHRLLNVLSHEYCHLANFMISNIRDQPHGASFKRWAALASAEFASRGIEVTTKHNYEISYKYAWQCSDADRCGVLYQRHSKSIDPGKQACGKCKGRLVQVRPVPRGKVAAKGSIAGSVGGAPVEQGEGRAGMDDGKTEYQKFVKEHFRHVREDLGPKSPMKDVMREVGARYRSFKAVSAQENTSVVIGAKTMGEERAEKVVMDSAVTEVEVIEIADTDDEDVGDNTGSSEPAEVRDGGVDKVSRVLDFLTIRDE